MKILVFGNSDSAGVQLPDRSEAWPRVLARDLEAQTGTPVDLALKFLVADAPGAVGYLERLLAEHRPDAVVMIVASYRFALRSVDARLGRVFGKRVGRAALGLQRWSEARARTFGAPGEATYAFMRRGVRRVVGTEAVTPFAAAVDSYSAVIRRLAREEDLHVVVIGGVRFGRRYHELNPGLGDIVDRYKEVMRCVTLDHRFAWVDNQSALEAAGDPEQFYLADGRHRDARGHRLLAEALIPVIAPWAREGL